MGLSIKVENLSKAYRLGQLNTGALSQDIERWWAIFRGNEDPFLKIGETNNRVFKGSSNIVWSLRDIDFSVERGEVIGIIGKNGAGKSTLLKVLSRVTAPTKGNIKIKGRIASLLEVGTGFHPELTGRENIFLNGAILGMREREIKKRFDEIVDFAGVERYIETPVKRYSSGMYVRLAFAVAAHLESEILIVDEVLAVGDHEFQKKCIGKMSDISKGERRTILFVSHNMGSVKSLCQKAILLENGMLTYSGTVQKTIDHYLQSNQNNKIHAEYVKGTIDERKIQLVKARILDERGNNKSEFDISEDIYFELTLKCMAHVPDLYGYVVIKSIIGNIIVESDTHDYPPNIMANLCIGENTFHLKLNRNVLAFGDYIFYLSLSSTMTDSSEIERPGDIMKFFVVDNETMRGHKRLAATSHLLKWETKTLVN